MTQAGKEKWIVSLKVFGYSLLLLLLILLGIVLYVLELIGMGARYLLRCMACFIDLYKAALDECRDAFASEETEEEEDDDEGFFSKVFGGSDDEDDEEEDEEDSLEDEEDSEDEDDADEDDDDDEADSDEEEEEDADQRPDGLYEEDLSQEPERIVVAEEVSGETEPSGLLYDWLTARVAGVTAPRGDVDVETL